MSAPATTYFAGAGLITLIVTMESGQAGLITAGLFLIIYSFCCALKDEV